jgi:hypothetical protein
MRDFSLLYNVQTGSGAHKPPYPKDTAEISWGGRDAAEA